MVRSPWKDGAFYLCVFALGVAILQTAGAVPRTRARARDEGPSTGSPSDDPTLSDLVARLEQLQRQLTELRPQAAAEPKLTWRGWLWNILTRTKPPPIQLRNANEEPRQETNQDVVHEDAPEAVTVMQCVAALGGNAVDILSFALGQMWRLCTDPLHWTQQIEEELSKLVLNLEENAGPKIGLALSAGLLFVLINVTSWLILRLLDGVTHVRFVDWISDLAVVRLFRRYQQWRQLRQGGSQIEREIKDRVGQEIAQWMSDHNMMGTVDATQAEVNVVCYRCGRQGHFARDCPRHRTPVLQGNPGEDNPNTARAVGSSCMAQTQQGMIPLVNRAEELTGAERGRTTQGHETALCTSFYWELWTPLPSTC